MDCRSPLFERVPYQDVPRVATFGFPPLQNKACYSLFFSTSDDPGTPQDTNVSSDFCYDPAYRLIALQLFVYTQSFSPTPGEDSPDVDPPPTPSVDNDDDEEDSDEDNGNEDDHDDASAKLYMFVHAGTLERHCEKRKPGNEIPWDDWASEARLMRQPGDGSVWLFDCVSYRRCLVRATRPRDDTSLSIMLYDFPPPFASRHPNGFPADEHGPWQYVAEPGVINAEYLFSKPVVSGLSYRKVDTGFVEPALGNPERGEKCYHYLTPECVLGCMGQKFVYLQISCWHF